MPLDLISLTRGLLMRQPLPSIFRLSFSLAILAGILPVSEIFSQGQWQAQTSGTSEHLRGLSAVSDQVVWASGTKGAFIRTIDGGKNWQAGRVRGAEELDFRDVDAFDADTAYLLSIGKGESSRIYKTTDGGRSWSLQFKNTDAEAFFDAMAFWDSRHGIAMSDPVNGRFLIVTTEDGGATWKQAPPENMPKALPNEGGFAASGTCLTVEGRNNVWFGTGGAAKARVFRSTDRGRTWTVAETPILAGIASAGIFSIAFKDPRNGVVVGGDYQKPGSSEKTVALTADGGRTWGLVEGSKPAGFRSSVAYLRGKRARALVAVGTSGSDYSIDGGTGWVNLDRENYNVVSVAKNGSTWAAGPRGRISLLNRQD